MSPRITPDVQVRYLLPKDTEGVLSIASQCDFNPCDALELQHIMQRRGHYGLVVEQDGQITAYAMYRVVAGNICLLGVNFNPSHSREQQEGFLRQMIGNLEEMAARRGDRAELVMDVSEGDLQLLAQLATVGFKADRGLLKEQGRGGEDAIRMRYLSAPPQHSPAR